MANRITPWNAANGLPARKILQRMQLIYYANPTSPETHKISLGSYTGIGVLIRVGGRYWQKYYSLTDKGFRIATIEQRLHGV